MMQRYASSAIINGIRLSDHVGLVYHVVQRYSHIRGKLDEDDLLQAGMMGLCKGLARFQPDRGLKVTTYVIHWVKHYVLRCIQNESRDVRVPVYRREAGRDLPGEWSLDAPMPMTGEPWVDSLQSHEPNPEELVLELDAVRQRNTRVRSALRKLPPRDRHVLRRRVQHHETLAEVAARLPSPERPGQGLTREAVRQIEARAKRKLHRELSKERDATDL